MSEPIELDLEQETYDSLIDLYVRTKLMEESRGVFDDYIKGGSTTEAALASAVINEMANIALHEMIKEINIEDEQK